MVVKEAWGLLCQAIKLQHRSGMYPAAQEAEIDAQIVRNMAGPRAKALSVFDFVDVTHNFLTNLGEVVVSGEISQISDRNHMYFALKDQNSKVDCLMFSRDKEL